MPTFLGLWWKWMPSFQELQENLAGADGSGKVMRDDHNCLLVLSREWVNGMMANSSPHHCVGFLFLNLYTFSSSSACSSSSASSFVTPFLYTRLCHRPSFTHIFVTHHLSHTQLCHTPSFIHNFVTQTQHLCHTHNIFVTQCHTPPFTHNFVTYHPSHASL